MPAPLRAAPLRNMAGPITGSLGTWQQPSTWGRNESGNHESWVFEGDKTSIKNLAATFAAQTGLAYEVTEHFGKSRLEVQFPWNADGTVNPATDYVERWELFSNKHEKDLLDAQDNGGIIASISQKQRVKLRQAWDNPKQVSDPPYVQSDFTTGDGNDANAFYVFNLWMSGMRGYLMGAPVLRRTIITSLAFTIGYTLINARRLVSTGYIAVDENLPSGLIFNLPAYLGSDSSTDPLLTYGWYKELPTIQECALLKWQIVQEWQYGWWPVGLYGAAILP